jgi:hypothetical protein
MASRTPRRQLRSQYNPHWGEYAAAGDLPNTAGAPLAASEFSLQAGDLAFVTGDGTYECMSAGGAAATPPAVWQKTGGVGGDSVDTINGFPAGNYYEAAAGIATGGAAFSAIWYGYFVDFVEGAGQFLFGHTSGGFNGGWSGAIGGRAGTGGVNVFYANAISVGPAFAAIDEVVDQQAVWHRAGVRHYALSVESGVEIRGWIDGVRQRFSPQAFGVFLPSPTGRFRLGRGGFFGFEAAQNVGCAGAGYAPSLLTDTLVQNHLQACRDAGFRFVSGGIGWQHRWDVRATFAGPGPAPAVLPDLEAAGGDLTLVGALTERRRRI